MPGRIQRITSQGQLVPLYFGQEAVAASQTDVQLPAPMGEATQVNDGYVMPFPWELVAITYQLSAAATAGQLTIGATLGGAEDADTTITVTTAATGRKSVSRAKMFGPAGGVIGAEITTTAAWDAIAADLAVVLWVIVYLEGI